MAEKDTVTRQTLANMLHQRFGFSRAEAGDFVDDMLEELCASIEQEGETKISSFGTFKVSHKKPRVGRNPKTKEEATISARNVVSFYASNMLKSKVNASFSK